MTCEMTVTESLMRLETSVEQGAWSDERLIRDEIEV